MQKQGWEAREDILKTVQKTFKEIKKSKRVAITALNSFIRAFETPGMIIPTNADKLKYLKFKEDVKAITQFVQEITASQKRLEEIMNNWNERRF